MSEEKRIVSRDEFVKMFVGADEKRQREIRNLLIMGALKIGDTDKTPTPAAQPAARSEQ